jgi:serine O-acetyltransferase
MFRILLEDLGRKAEWYELPRNWRSLLRMCVSDGSTCQILYRMMRFCQQRRLKLPALALYRLNALVGHAVIGRDADLGPGLVILHSFGIVINSQVRAGKNLVLEHGVTIGAEKGRSPVLGDNVFLGAGAKVIGNVRIGSDVKVGANAVVTRDLPDGATAVGVPARVIKIYGRRVEEDGTPVSRPPDLVVA